MAIFKSLGPFHFPFRGPIGVGLRTHFVKKGPKNTHFWSSLHKNPGFFGEGRANSRTGQEIGQKISRKTPPFWGVLRGILGFLDQNRPLFGGQKNSPWTPQGGSNPGPRPPRGGVRPPRTPPPRGGGSDPPTPPQGGVRPPGGVGVDGGPGSPQNPQKSQFFQISAPKKDFFTQKSA